MLACNPKPLSMIFITLYQNAKWPWLVMEMGFTDCKCGSRVVIGLPYLTLFNIIYGCKIILS